MEPRTPSSGEQRHERVQNCATARAYVGVRPSTNFILGIDAVFLSRLLVQSPLPWQNSSMQFYRRNLPHMQRDYTPHFITFCTKFRRILPDWARDIVLGCCIHDHGRRYRLELAVVMPDHVHLILTPLVLGASDQGGRGHPALHIVSLVEIMKAIEGASAHAINRQAGRYGAVWQEESFDRVVRSSESLDAKIAYILQNPVRKALVEDWCQYRWIWQSPKENRYAPPPSIIKQL